MFQGLTFFSILLVLITFFILILGLLFAIYIVYNRHSKDIDELSNEEKEIIDNLSINETSNKKFEHIFFL
ncbi:MAG: hypothetical protein ACUVQN_04450 [Caldisericia bacterium]